MDFKWLHTFVTAAKYENFRKTAETLFLSQPTVTVHIKQLERNQLQAVRAKRQADSAD